MAERKKEVKREERKRNPEAFGIAGFTLGIVSIVMILFDPMVGFLISLVGIFFVSNSREWKRQEGARLESLKCNRACSQCCDVPCCQCVAFSNYKSGLYAAVK